MRRGRYDKPARPGKGPGSPAGSEILDAPDREEAYRESVARLEALYFAAVERRIAEKRKAPVLGVSSAYAERAEPDLTGPRSAARHLAQVETHLALLLALEARGKLSADESKTVPALSREIRALRSELALGAFDEKGELRDDDGEL